MKNKNQSYNQEVRQCLSQMRLAEFKTVQIYYLASERHQEKFEDTKDVIRSCNSKKDRQYNVRKKQDKKKTMVKCNTTWKTQDEATRTPLKTWVNSGALEGKAVPAPVVAPVLLLLL